MHELRTGDTGEAVRLHQEHLNARLRAHRDTPIEVDGELGPITLEQTAYAAWFLGALDGTVEKVRGGLITVGVQEIVADPKVRNAQQRERARARRDVHFGNLRERAYKVAEGLVGVMEIGGNNAGPMVSKIIVANGGAGPEPWCGDFVAYCYRNAGSQGVDRVWASVRQLGLDPDVHQTPDPERGDLVRFSFDHVGLFVRRVDANTIETIEGNTGASGAVSDSRRGGDGVYRKHRAASLVTDYLRVER
ncbi:CHAP domain-containing protein [Solirubrobacter sp. CPCC 204708]|uniref:CHAP domain-containing protein n=1 Tax=Solirubrobacter deserti TaxID=2282478 RepID=A0ABT4RHQ8_9ACTN|nr:CHAP domain-containing protein [Solirubrobacter deserti]MBE2316553.1 CHAP domain-containing protein [Solirubrobacter deserti]MDA0138087.1 CHAP domain-containing protein [Solirubrobacter deserti]